MTEPSRRRWELRRQLAAAERKVAYLRKQLDALPVPQRRGGPRRCCAVVHGATRRGFASILDAARAEGVSRAVMRTRLRDPASGWRRAAP